AGIVRHLPAVSEHFGPALRAGFPRRLLVRPGPWKHERRQGQRAAGAAKGASPRRRDRHRQAALHDRLSVNGRQARDGRNDGRRRDEPVAFGKSRLGPSRGGPAVAPATALGGARRHARRRHGINTHEQADAEVAKPREHLSIDDQTTYITTMKLAGKAALVTGASAGIGLATARALAREGADVALDYLSDEPQAEQLAGEIRELGRRVLLLPVDVSDQAAVEAMVTRVVAELGRLDILVCCAVYSDRELFHIANMDG